MRSNAASNTDFLRGLTSDLVTAFVGHNAVGTAEVPRLISTVYASLTSLSQEKPAEPSAPAVPVARSKTPGHLVCLNCGKKFRTLSRHLETQHGLTPQKYRTKWDLPGNYPMICDAYSAARSAIAKGEWSATADDVVTQFRRPPARAGSKR